MTSDVKINRGLKGVYFERSGASDIDGAAGTLSYRGYDINDLAEHANFEEVAYLLIHGELPSQADANVVDPVPVEAVGRPMLGSEVVEGNALYLVAVALDEALEKLAVEDPVKAELVKRCRQRVKQKPIWRIRLNQHDSPN